MKKLLSFLMLKWPFSCATSYLHPMLLKNSLILLLIQTEPQIGPSSFIPLEEESILQLFKFFVFNTVSL